MSDKVKGYVSTHKAEGQRIVGKEKENTAKRNTPPSAFPVFGVLPFVWLQAVMLGAHCF